MDGKPEEVGLALLCGRISIEVNGRRDMRSAHRGQEATAKCRITERSI